MELEHRAVSRKSFYRLIFTEYQFLGTSWSLAVDIQFQILHTQDLIGQGVFLVFRPVLTSYSMHEEVLSMCKEKSGTQRSYTTLTQ